MKVADLIEALRQLPADYEIAMLATSAMPRPPVVVLADPSAFRPNRGGFENPSRAYLLRPEEEII